MRLLIKFRHFILLLLFSMAILEGNAQLNLNCEELPGGIINTSILEESYCFDGHQGNTLETTSSANVEIKGYKSITLKNGFKATPSSGGEFNAHLERPFTIDVLSPSQGTDVKIFDKLEIGINLSPLITTQINDFINNTLGTTKINPYDPDPNSSLPGGINIEAVFTAPSGNIRKTFGFYYEDFNIHPDKLGWDLKSPQNQTYPWRIRLAPDELGLWDLKIKINATGFTSQEISGIQFNVTPSSNKGYLVMSQNDRYFTFNKGGLSDEQKAFFMVGQNQWHPLPKIADWDSEVLTPLLTEDVMFKRLRDIANNGGNTIRFRFHPKSYGLSEWGIDPIHKLNVSSVTYPINGLKATEILGNYNAYQVNMWEMDRVIDYANNLNNEFNDVEDKVNFIIVLDNLAGLELKKKEIKDDEGNVVEVIKFIDGSRFSWYNVATNTSMVSYDNISTSSQDAFNGGIVNHYKYGNPYLDINKDGSLLLRPQDFFSNTKAKKHYKNRLRYMIARWGYATNILAWAFHNELEGIFNYEGIDPHSVANLPNIVAWHTEMSNYMKNDLDVQQLTTTGFAGPFPGANIWSNLDFATFHRYGDSQDIDAVRNQGMRNFVTAPQNSKAVLLGEFDGSKCERHCYDRDIGQHLSFHNTLWANAFAGSIGSGLHFGWNYIAKSDDAGVSGYPDYGGKKGLYDLYSPLSNFFEGEVVGKSSVKPIGTNSFNPDADFFGTRLIVTSHSDIRSYALRYDATDRILGWVQNKDSHWMHAYFSDATYNPPQTSPVVIGCPYPYSDPDDKIECPGSSGGSVSDEITTTEHLTFIVNQSVTDYVVEWWSTWNDSKMISSTIETSSFSFLDVELPHFVLYDYDNTVNDAPDYAYKIYPAQQENRLKSKTMMDTEPSSVSVYPNPFNDMITISGLSSDVPVKIDIKDVLGHKLLSNNYAEVENISIDLSNFNDGVYILEIVEGQKRTTLKIIKQ